MRSLGAMGNLSLEKLGDDPSLQTSAITLITSAKEAFHEGFVLHDCLVHFYPTMTDSIAINVGDDLSNHASETPSNTTPVQFDAFMTSIMAPSTVLLSKMQSGATQLSFHHKLFGYRATFSI
ncbi:unnamed protein product [Lactuca virosa]|uniref:Uncharacterized protein n=1 Tax=Lactuca virosa TaxID=75947 RepID=A0AAU9N1N6_9ASTR|nr:unnamed protein product [Lactuca virosa]